MHRFYVPPEECTGPEIELTGREAHHAAQVLRVRRGDSVHVLDGAGQDLACTIRDHGRDRVQLEVVERRSVPPPACEITLLQGLPKGKLFEAIIQKSVELGARGIIPLMTERVVAHFDREDGAAKTERWRMVAIEAIKQCGSAWLPTVEEPITPQRFLERGQSPELSLFGSLQFNARHPRHYFQSFERSHQRRPKSVSVWVGPEGDFSPGEVAALESASILPITLGPLVLRTETAAAYCLSVVNYELQAPASETAQS